MGRGPYRSADERHDPQPDERRGLFQLDAMLAGTLLFLLGCALGRVGLSLRAREVDDDLVLALAVAAGAAWKLVAMWRRRKRGD